MCYSRRMRYFNFLPLIHKRKKDNNNNKKKSQKTTKMAVELENHRAKSTNSTSLLTQNEVELVTLAWVEKRISVLCTIYSI